MAFKIRKIGSNEETLFSVKTLLGVIGDPTNDEIVINSERYRLSTAVELGESGTSILPDVDWQRVQLLVQQPGQVHFSVLIPRKDLQGIFLFVNGLHYEYGTSEDFHLNDDGTILTWHGGFNLSATDKIYVRYMEVRFPEPAQ